MRTTPVRWKESEPAALVEALDTLEAQQHDFPFEIDGAVIKVNDRSRYDALGSTLKARAAVAYKYEPDRDHPARYKRCRAHGCAYPCRRARTGALVLKRATLHNQDEISRKDIRIGDRVLIEKAGEIIPVVVCRCPQNEKQTSRPIICPQRVQPVMLPLRKSQVR